MAKNNSKQQQKPETDVFEAEVLDAFESVDTTEAAAGTLKGVKLLGLRSRNGKNYDSQGVRNTAISRLSGARVYVDHPEDARKTRSYSAAFGFVQEGTVEYRAGKGYYGTIRWNPQHPAASQFAWDVANTPKNLGMSINGRVKTGGRDSQGDLVVESIDEIRSVDLVTRPATAVGIFESEEPSAGSETAEEQENMELKEALEALEAMKKQNAEMAAQMKASNETLEAVRKEREAEKVRGEVTEAVTKAFAGTAVSEELQKEVIECACQMADAESRKRVLDVVTKFGPLFEDDGKDITGESFNEPPAKAPVKAPQVGTRARGASAPSNYSLRASLGLK